jgi:hypothetical protein
VEGAVWFLILLLVFIGLGVTIRVIWGRREEEQPEDKREYTDDPPWWGGLGG